MLKTDEKIIELFVKRYQIDGRKVFAIRNASITAYVGCHIKTLKAALNRIEKAGFIIRETINNKRFIFLQKPILKQAKLGGL